MSIISLTKLCGLLSDKMGKETAENLANFIEENINKGLDNKTQILATKDEITAVKDDISNVKLAIEQCHVRIEQSKAEIIKWMFIFWIGQVIATFGFILLFLK